MSKKTTIHSLTAEQVAELREIGKDIGRLQDRLDHVLGGIATGKAATPRSEPSAKPGKPGGTTGKATALKGSVMAVLAEAPEPMTFDEIFRELKKTGGLPAEKPMLAVRKLLYATKEIKAGRAGLKGGVFSLRTEDNAC